MPPLAEQVVDPDELPGLRDVAEYDERLTELEEREAELNEAFLEANREYKEAEREYLRLKGGRDDFDKERAALSYLDGEEPEIASGDWQDSANRAKKAKRRAEALKLAREKCQQRQKEIKRSPEAAQALADLWRDDVEANAAEIANLTRRLWERLEIHDQLRRKFFGEVSIRWDELPFFPPPGGGRSRIGTGRQPPDLPRLIELCAAHFDDFEDPR